MKQTLDLDKFNSKDPKVKYGFAKELLKLGKDSPSLLYDYFDNWVEMMKSDNNIVIGKVVVTLNGFLDDINDNKEVLIFIKQAQHSTRNATKKKADTLMNKINN